jgi:hypothetical protein
MNRPASQNAQPGYKHFKTAIYARVYEVQQMSDLGWLAERFELVKRFIKVDKVYLETHRDMVVAEEATLRQAQRYFEDQGIRASGGITITVNERNRFETYCYTNPLHRQKLREVVEYTATLFNEVILDDFFFTNCKCETCIRAKGERSWTQFRLALMEEAARELVIEPARTVKPNVNLVIKYPNWYEHFQGLGFHLEAEPGLFDGLYTGTETRDAHFGNQHLQPYHGYLIFRYFENLKPGCNAGGWVDTGASFTLDRYAEQLWLTLFAQAPEITLFDFRQLQRPIKETERAAWQGNGTSFDFDAMMEKVSPGKKDKPGGEFPPEATFALAAGYALEVVDPILAKLGNPLGVKSYKPYHSTGEDFLHNYLGMIGIPMDIVPEYPQDAGTIFLAESAAHDPSIVEKIRQSLIQGKNVIITSGLLQSLQYQGQSLQFQGQSLQFQGQSLQGKGIEDIVELRVTSRKALVDEFQIGWFGMAKSEKKILIPHIDYLTNDSWEEVSGVGASSGNPVLHSARYANGMLYVLTIPDDFSDLYALPREALTRIRQAFAGGMDLRLDAPSLTTLFLYDNQTLIVESFRAEAEDIKLVLSNRIKRVWDVLSGEELKGEKITDWWGNETGESNFQTKIKPHSFRVFQYK